jgi:AcrR family transcriptional regulator
MPPRRYRARARELAAAKTRARILDAVVKLHAERGVTGTTYAMIAKLADVAIPTVYNHFPTQRELLAACTRKVVSAGPALDAGIFSDSMDLESRLRALAAALFASYRCRAPWLRWAVHEAVLVRPLQDLVKQAAALRRRLIAEALEPDFGPRPPQKLVAVAEVLLDFPAWQRLTRNGRAAVEDAAQTIADALLALARDRLTGATAAPALALQLGRTKGASP